MKKLEFSENPLPPEPIEFCEKCGEPTKYWISITTEGHPASALCKCDRAEREAIKAASEADAKQSRLKRLRSLSLMDEKGNSTTFDSITLYDDTRKYFEAGKRYCENWTSNSNENQGLLFHGETGRGKTTLSYCIANDLLDKGISVVMTSPNKLLQSLRESYTTSDDVNMNESAILSALQNAELLILDDLGSEHRTDWGISKMYEVIDARYRGGNPIIITTNLSLAQLKEHYSDSNGISRIFDRLVEMLCFVSFDGDNKRINAHTTSKYDFLKS